MVLGSVEKQRHCGNQLENYSNDMESNQVEARRAINIAERKISENDYVGAKKLVIKAQTLYPNLDGLQQVMMMIDVYISASKKINGGREADWYRILGVDPLADEESVKKHYKKLALLLHPDKNKFTGATEAFKLVSEAKQRCLLSDKAKRVAYDQQRTQKPQNPHKPASTNGNQDASDGARSNEAASGTQKPPNPHKPAPVDPPKQRKDGIFWTMCYSCMTPCQYPRSYYLDKAVCCRNCDQIFIATEKTPSASFVRPVNVSSKNRTRSFPRSSVRFTCSFPTNPSASVRASYRSENAANKSQERSKRVFEKVQETLAAAERVRKKLKADVR